MMLLRPVPGAIRGGELDRGGDRPRPLEAAVQRRSAGDWHDSRRLPQAVDHHRRCAAGVPRQHATDPLVFIGAALFLAAVALAPSYLPARRAAHIDLNDALRCQ